MTLYELTAGILENAKFKVGDEVTERTAGIGYVEGRQTVCAVIAEVGPSGMVQFCYAIRMRKLDSWAFAHFHEIELEAWADRVKRTGNKEGVIR